MPPSRSRPCDTCRVRKTRCVKSADRAECILCAFHGKQCTYLRGPTPRARRAAAAAAAAAGGNSSQISAPGSLPPSSGAPQQMQLPLQQGESVVAAPVDSATPPETSLSPDDMSSDDTPLSLLLDGTLGLDLHTHPEYIGPSNFLEPALLDLVPPPSPTPNPTPNPSSASSPPSDRLRRPRQVPRRLDDRTMFLVYSDESTASESQRIAACDAIEESVRPLGKVLVDLYFRIVHPSFPVLHKGVFLAKHAVSHRTFSPPLLAAVYLIALDYQLYDSATAAAASASGTSATVDGNGRPANPDGQVLLEDLAERTMADDLKRPKLSTLQAGLLLLQRTRLGAASSSSTSPSATNPSSWLFTAQMVALAQALGLHVDCRAWSIPEWEKGLRRRLAWALYVQDRWDALLRGRPPLLSDGAWDLQPCSAEDFPETASEADEVPDADGSVPINTGREVFIRHAQLALLISEIMALFYTGAATKPGGHLDKIGPAATTEAAKPLVLRLRQFHSSLPPELSLERIHFRRLSSNASLHLAYAAAEAALQRALVRAVTPPEACAPQDLIAAVRSAARARVATAVTMLASLRPEHTGAFWPAVAGRQVVSLASLAGLLWATAWDEAEMLWCAERMDELRWALQVRGQAVPFMRDALRLLECVGGPMPMAGRSALGRER